MPEVAADERKYYVRAALLFALMIVVPLAAGLIGSVLFFALIVFQDYMVVGRLAGEVAGDFGHLVALAVVLSCVAALYTIMPTYIALQIMLRRTGWSLRRIILITSLLAAMFAILGPIAIDFVDSFYRGREISLVAFWREVVMRPADILLHAAVAHVISMALATWLVLKAYGATMRRGARG